MRPLALLLAVVACTPEDVEPTEPDPYDVTVGPYETDIVWTEHGVPHITGDDYGSVGYGMGYALARDNGCIVLDQITRMRGENAKYLGPEGLLDRDFGWKALEVVQRAEEKWFELEPYQQEIVIGYAAGVTRWVEEGDPPPQCGNDPRLRPIDHIDLLTLLLGLGLEGSGAVWVQEIGSGQPPGGQSPPPPIPGLDRWKRIQKEIRNPKRGSNGWSLGSERTASGGGMVLSNTHFPALGEKRWHESHLTIPGELDIYGVSLIGVPVINIGFNRNVAWTHTVSPAPRFVAYLLELDPADPTRYLYDGEYREMTSKSYTVEVLEDGEIREVTRTLWRSHYGPMINAPLLGWSDQFAVTFRDVNDANIEMFHVWDRMNHAESLDQLVDAHRETLGIPWVFTLAAGTDGRLFFGDTSRAPDLSLEAQQQWPVDASSNLLLSQFAQFGVIGVNGSNPLYEFQEDPNSPVPGVVPFDRMPTAIRTDYAFNANDAAWLHHVGEPMTDYEAALFGGIETPISSRTRMNGRFLDETGPDAASGEDGKFDLAEMEAAALSMRSLIAEEALAAVVARCTGVTTVERSAGPVDITQACTVLAGWDGHYTTDAVGAIVWREFLGSSRFDTWEINNEGGGLFSVPYDPADPVDTPNTVVAAAEDPNEDVVLQALAEAVERLEGAGIALDAALGDHQFLTFGNQSTMPMPGGQYWEGTIGISDYQTSPTTTLFGRYIRGELIHEATELAEDGYPANNGNSYILAVDMTPDGPQARAVMTYSQSSDSRSEFYDDQTPIYASGSLREVRFEREDIEANAVEQVTLSFTP